jgi:hypothetical protein
MQTKRNPLNGMQLSIPIPHPDKGFIYALATKGFNVQFHRRQPSTKNPTTKDFLYAIPNRKKLVNKSPMAIMEKRRELVLRWKIPLNGTLSQQRERKHGFLLLG